ANTPVTIAYKAANATSVSIPGIQNVTLAGPVTVTPTQTTTYTITAAGANNTSATCSVTVTVNIPTGPPPTAIITGPSSITTLSRFLTLDASQSTNPAGGALTYTWEAFGTGAAILDQGQPITRVQLGGLFGDYVFRVT